MSQQIAKSACDTCRFGIVSRPDMKTKAGRKKRKKEDPYCEQSFAKHEYRLILLSSCRCLGSLCLKGLSEQRVLWLTRVKL